MSRRDDRRWAWATALTVFVACLAAYLPTLNPAFRADDSPETLTACFGLGIQHPPGYPLHTLVGRLATLLPLGAVAWRGNLLAAFAGALACALLAAWLFFVALESLRREGAAPAGAAWLAAASGLAGGLFLGLGQTYWSQSLAAKGGIYTLHMVFVAGAWGLLWRWGRDAESRPDAGPSALLRLPSARLSVFVLALGLGNHWETQALVLPAAGLFAALTLWPRWRDRRAAAAARKAAAPEAWAAALLPLALLAALGCTVWLYLPVRARLDPFLDWGDPRGWQQFWWVFLRQEYLDLESGFVKSLRAALLGAGDWKAVAENWAFVQRQGLRVLSHLFVPAPDLGLPAAALSLLGLWQWRPGLKTLAARFSASLAALALGFVLIITFYFHLKEEMVWILDVFLLPAYLAQAAFAAMGALWLWRRWAGAWPAWIAAAAALALAPGLYALRAPDVSQARQYLAWDYGMDLLLSVKPHGILLAEGDFNTMPIYYLQQVAGRRPDVDHVTTVFLSTDWGVEHAKRRQPRLGIGAVPKASTGARAGDAQVLRAALGSMAAANAGRPIQASLFRQVLQDSVPEWNSRWRPWGLADQVNAQESPAEERGRFGLLQAFRTRHLELDRSHLDPSPAFALSNYGSAFLNLANWLRQQGRVREALPLYARAVQWTSRANLAEAYTHWGIALGGGGQGLKPDYPAAERLFRRALEVKPLFEAYTNLAGVCNQQGQATGQRSYYQQAEAASRSALQMKPDSAQAGNNLAIALYYQGRHDEALAALREAARLAPQDPQILANLKALGGAR